MRAKKMVMMGRRKFEPRSTVIDQHFNGDAIGHEFFGRAENRRKVGSEADIDKTRLQSIQGPGVAIVIPHQLEQRERDSRLARHNAIVVRHSFIRKSFAIRLE
jgi:hypothetical protein